MLETPGELRTTRPRVLLTIDTSNACCEALPVQHFA